MMCLCILISNKQLRAFTQTAHSKTAITNTGGGCHQSYLLMLHSPRTRQKKKIVQILSLVFISHVSYNDGGPHRRFQQTKQ